MIAPAALPVSEHTGGSVEIAVYHIAKELSRSHQITIISKKTPELPPLTKIGNLIIKRVPANAYLARVLRYAKKHRFDCIQVDNRPRFIPLLRKTFPRTPLVLVLHSLAFLNRLPLSIQRAIIRSADRVIVNSEFLRNYYARHFPLWRKKIKAIYLGVDVDRFKPPSVTERMEELEQFGVQGSYNVLYVGRVIPKKGLLTLVRAVGLLRAKLESLRLIVVGNCRSKRYKRRLIKAALKHNVNIEFLGEIRPSKIHRVYWLGDCFVCPTRFREAFGLVNIEAMASGLPVIASKRGGIPEIINESNGLLVSQYQSPIAFANAIGQVIASPEHSRELSEKAVQTVQEKFDWAHAATSYAALYHRLKGKKR